MTRNYFSKLFHITWTYAYTWSHLGSCYCEIGLCHKWPARRSSKSVWPRVDSLFNFVPASPSSLRHYRDAWMEEAGSREVSAGAAVESSVWWHVGSRSQGAGGAVHLIWRNSSDVGWLDATNAKSSDSISTKCSVVWCGLSAAPSKRPSAWTEVSNNTWTWRSQRVDSISSTHAPSVQGEGMPVLRR